MSGLFGSDGYSGHGKIGQLSLFVQLPKWPLGSLGAAQLSLFEEVPARTTPAFIWSFMLEVRFIALLK
jgi:hypothetical protein